VSIGSWRCSGDGTANGVPGTGSEGMPGRITDNSWTASLDGEDARRDRVLGILNPMCRSGKSRMLSVCSTMLLLWPSVCSEGPANR
jgi:hypothetical protein